MITRKLQVNINPDSSSVNVYVTSVSPTGNSEPGAWELETVTAPPEGEVPIGFGQDTGVVRMPGSRFCLTSMGH